MSGYLQTSTANPYGFRPWGTRLYTSFDEYAYLKQPQNTIIRGDQSMRPEIYKPPELAGLGAHEGVTVVSGSGRVMGRTRRRHLHGLGAIIMQTNGGGGIVRYGGYPGITFPRPLPPIVAPNVIAPQAIAPVPQPAPPPLTIYPPPSVPPVPQLYTSGPGGVVYALPGNATTPGSPFFPPAPGELPGAPSGSGVPVSAVTGAAAAAISPGGSFSDWFNSSTFIAGWPNGYLAIGAIGLFLLLRKKGR